MPTAIHWFRRDLRISDNQALTDAVRFGDAVVPAFVLPAEGPHASGPASRAWLAHSIAALDADLRAGGSSLVVRSGSAADALAALAVESGASAVFCQRDWTPGGLAEEDAVRRTLASAGVGLEVREGQLLMTPDALSTAEGRAYRVFTPYYRRWAASFDPASVAPLPAPSRIPAPASMPGTESLPTPGDALHLTRWWEPGEASGARRLSGFAQEALADYARDRDRPSVDGTSKLSPYLAWGEVSPRQVAAAISGAGDASEGGEPFLRQVAWREFAYHVLHHFPNSLERPLRAEFEAFPWADDERGLDAWRAGETGYPLVDAGMRQLAQTGWMHNRVRLVAASLLAKHLLQPWQTGEAWFNERLVDFDPALNAFNWQWVAGSGADAAPYFRIFNPTVQGERFDSDGTYVREWVPELAKLPARWIHRPWKTPAEALREAGIELGRDYPAPIIEHAEARARALAAFSAIRSSTARRR